MYGRQMPCLPEKLFAQYGLVKYRITGCFGISRCVISLSADENRESRKQKTEKAGRKI